MKKIMIFLLVTLFPTLVFAKDYTVDDINTTINVDDNYIVITRDSMLKTDLDKLNVSREYIEEIMDESDIYYIITKNDISYEVLLAVPNNELPFNDLKDVDDQTFIKIRKDFAERTETEEISYYKNNYRFIVVEHYDELTKYYVINYYTVVNAHGYNFQLQKKTPITDKEKAELKGIIDKTVIKPNQKEIIDVKEITGYNYKNVIYAIIIGLVVGITVYIIDTIRRGKKSSK